MMPGSRSWIVSKMRLKTMGNNPAIASPQSFNGKFPLTLRKENETDKGCPIRAHGRGILLPG